MIVAWLLTVGVLTALGLGLEGKLTAQTFYYVEGSSTKQAHEIAVREFGNQESLIVLLRGSRREVQVQGRELETRLDALPRTLVLSPWDRGGAIRGLNPSPGEAALVVNVNRLSSENVSDILHSVERVADRTVDGEVKVSIAGAPAIVDSYRSAMAEAVAAGERIAIPILLVVLLVVFRSLLAALIPVIMGGAVVAATHGVLALLLSTVKIDAFALGAAGTMGLALGIDYSLLLVSRFREELEETDDVRGAVQRTVPTAGRSVIPAGCGLVLAMLVSSQILSNPIVSSAAIAISTATILSVISAIFVVPALLTLVGDRVNRWSLPRRLGRGGVAALWSHRLSTRPRAFALPIVLFMVLASAWAFTLDTGTATPALLPPHDRGRLQQEEVQRALGPGWVGPVEVVMDGRGSPVTTPRRLHALAAFQHHVEADPAVQTVVGLAGIANRTKSLSGLQQQLDGQSSKLDRLADGIARAYGGASRGAASLDNASGGARDLGSAVGATSDGAGLVAEGLRSADSGSERLADGLSEATDGSGELAGGSRKVRQGARHLSEALASAEERTDEVAGSAHILKSAMQTGRGYVAEAQGLVGATAEQLTAAEEALRRMTTGRADGEWATALAAVEAANRALTGGEDGQQGEAGSSVAAAVDRADGQLSLGEYLADRQRKMGHQASSGMAELTQGLARLSRGVRRLAHGNAELYQVLARLTAGGQALSPALQRLVMAATHLAGGLRGLESGAVRLAEGLGGGAQRSWLLASGLGKVRRGIERQQGETTSVDRLDRQSPGLFKSGYLYLASLDGSGAGLRSESSYLVSLDRGGFGARMLVIPRLGPTDPDARRLLQRLENDADSLAERTGTAVLVGGVLPAQIDVNDAFRGQSLLARLALALVTFLVLVPVVRSLLLPLIAALLNLLTVAATLGLLALLFDNSWLGGPGYVDAAVIPATVMVIFGLAIDYEVFILARVREEYVRTGSPSTAIDWGIDRTAHVITGAALIMICVFLTFAVSAFATLRNFGVAQALAVFIDAFIVRLIVLPALMRALGRLTWWMPRWLDQLLPGGSSVVWAKAAPEKAVA